MTDVFFRPLYAFIVVALGSRHVVHVGVTRHPIDAWVARQLREATPFGEAPRLLIRDNDGKYGARFDRLAAASGGSGSSARPSARRGPTRRASGSWAACGGNVWTTS